MAMPAVERLVNLTIALLETRRPLTFDELRRRTGYYPQADAASARRMFERDKETLRSLGVPIETRQDFGMEDPGYLIDRRTYELRGVDLDAEEVAALALAVEMLGAGGPRSRSRRSRRAPRTRRRSIAATRVGIPVTDVDAFAPPSSSVACRPLRVPHRRRSERDADRRAVRHRAPPPRVVPRRTRPSTGGPRGFRTDRMLGGARGARSGRCVRASPRDSTSEHRLRAGRRDR
jgi:proteasome accessory factor B